jgi:GntP family gluconate:H+ symporter
LIGLPLFFETGLVLLLPILASASSDSRPGGDAKVGVMMSALAGLSVVHALVPPHPGPLIAISALGANLGRTLTYGLVVAVPTAILAGPVFARVAVRNVTLALPKPLSRVFEGRQVPVSRALVVVLLPVLLIVAGQVIALLPAGVASHLVWVSVASNPVLALLMACLAALPLLFGRRMGERAVQEAIWLETMKPVGAILLAIGAGGALKQVLVSSGFSDLLARFAAAASLSPILLGWLLAVAIRLATGSATVATITAAGVMTGTLAGSGVSAEWTVLAIGAGSLFFSHVNDPGFWLVKSYLGIDTPTMFRTWSVMETIISIVGLVLVLILSHLF